MSRNTVILLAGHVLMLVTFSLLWHYLPQVGKPRFAGTKLEPYIAVVFCGGFALSATMIALGFLDYFGNR